MKLTYSTLRFVPDPAKGESINVGLLVGDQETGQCRVVLDLGSRRRAHVLADRRTVDAVWSYLHDLKAGLEQHQGQWRDFTFADAWLRQRSAEGSNLLQFSSPAPVMARNVDEAAATLCGELLRATGETSRTPGFRKSALLAQVRRAYKAAGIEQTHLFERAVVAGPHHHEIFDFAVANGRTVQLAHAWNFRQDNLDPLAESVKAWAWTVRDIRGKGGQARIDKKTVRVPRNVLISAVYAPPTSAEGKSLLGEAVHAFKSVNVAAVPESHIENVAARVARLLHPARTAKDALFLTAR